ncbi:MAG: 4Fe-4S dicluster domain-containing protein [Planctomycetes bacterium]|nr:4Fe-4S dicluster domain-containing protein [Planctomycetota bacterium]
MMALLLVVSLGVFAYSARRRWLLMTIGSTPGPDDIADPDRRMGLMMRLAFGQQRLRRYQPAGFAHMAIFFGFLVLLLRSLILFARGFTTDPDFGYWLFDHGSALGNVYGLIKDIYIVLVVVGALIFLYLRLVNKTKRMTQSSEAVGILVIIVVMMIADVLYDGAVTVQRAGGADITFSIWEPLGTLAALGVMQHVGESANTFLMHCGFWAHVVLVLLFLNMLPFTKHFHVITAIPNVYLADLKPAGKLRTIDDLEGRVEREETLGVRRIDQLGWKAILDLYSCTECGRCTDQCPANRTGKKLSPKQLTINLRNFLYQHEPLLIRQADNGDDKAAHRVDLVPAVIDEESLWACTTCGACETECPVLIGYVDTIVDLRRHLVMERGEYPAPLQEAYTGLEVTGSPYSVDASQRLEWAEGLDVPVRSEIENGDDLEVLLWVGCAPAADERSRNTARAVAQLLNAAGVKWAVLGPEEQCTGDVARRSGNEYLFQILAQANIEVLNGYGTKRILTICPHCFNTLKHEYPDFGGSYEVLHHTEYLARLVTEGRLKITQPVEDQSVVYHDSCYLGRYNDIYDSPRDLLRKVPGLTVLEANASRDRGMCCGAGGGQMFKEEEQGSERVNIARTEQLLATGAGTIATACPFCTRMLSDGLNEKERAEDVSQRDIAEILLEAVG